MTKATGYPYRQKQLSNIRGEKWKDIPEFEGIYQVSNLGRIRSLDRTVMHNRHGTQFVEGRMLAQSIARNRNIKTGKPMIDLRVILSRDGSQFYFNVRRLVYIAFVNKKLNYRKDGLYVINKDGNGHNNRVSNLQLVTKSEKQQRVFTRKRQDSYLKTADRSKWPQTYGGYANRRPVKQYSLRGKLVRRFESIRDAARRTGFDEKGIIGAARGDFAQWRGYKWKYVRA